MQIAIFGASGATGGLLTQRSLAAGHTVTALVRTPAKFAYADRVRVVQGDAFDSGAIAQTVAEADAVFSTLGARSPFARDKTLQRGVPLIVAAMQAAGVRRIIALGSAGALDSAMDRQPAWQRWLVENIVYTTLLKYPVEAQRAQYRILAASDLDWTMALPPMLTNGPATGHIRVDGDALPRGATHLSRADVADFMFAQLNSEQWSRRGVYISN
jgi:putative NADH-flavin reductase